MAANYEDMRVEYGHSGLLEDIYKRIVNTADEVFKESLLLSADERQSLIARFEQGLRKAMSDNLRLTNDGESSTVEDRNNKSDSRLHYYCTEILPKVDSILVDVTRKRKDYPAKCKKLLDTKLVSEMTAYGTDTENEGNEAKRLAEDDQMDEELIGLASTVATNLSTFNQNSERFVKKANALRIAQTQLGKNGDVERKFDIGDVAFGQYKD